jgi:hypothetical protein
MDHRLATHAEAVYVARALNLQIEAVWQIIQGRHYETYADLELVVHTAFLQHQSDQHRSLSR